MNEQQLTLLVAAQGDNQAALSQYAATTASTAAQAFDAWYDHAQIAAYATALAAHIEAVQSQAASSTDAYLAEALADIKGERVSPAGTINVADLRKGVNHAEVYGRSADVYRYQRSLGKTVDEAQAAAVQRAEVMAQTDVQLAARAQSQRFMVVKKIGGWRRVVHPEVSKGGTCGLCIGASTRIYHKEDLMPMHARCVPGDSIVSASGVSAITRRNDPGPLVVLTTATGEQLRITPNHPILTDQGWLPAHLVNVGSQVVRSTRRHRVGRSGPQEHDRPATVEEIWRTATVDEGLRPRRVPLAAEDFHGDGSQGEVDVVATDGLLSDIGEVTFSKPAGHGGLVPGHRGRFELASDRSSLQALFGLRGATRNLVGSCGLRSTLSAGPLGVEDDLGFADASHLETHFIETAHDGGTARIQCFRDGQHRFAGFVPSSDLAVIKAQPDAARFDPALAEFSGQGRHAYARLGLDLRERLAADVELDAVVDKRWVEGPHVVYNLHTSEGWYASDSFIVSNCACTVLPIVNDQDPGGAINLKDLKTLYEQAGGSTAAAKLKRVRYVIHHNSELGPVLAVKGEAFRGPADVASDAA